MLMIDIQAFLALRHSLPVVDVRSEGEYADGHILSSTNIPLLNNGERVIVGTAYKQKGQHEAIKEGFRLVGPRLVDMLEDAEKIGNELLVYCWRGGMRSANFCQFASMAGLKAHRLEGGYKAYRRLAAEFFRRPMQFIVIGGCTGSGKSEILRALEQQGEQIIDLEKLANHKGSAFGGLMLPPQPTTEQFQNNLFEQLLKIDSNRRVWIEDESLAIGKIMLPNDLWLQMRSSPVIEIEVQKETRIKRLAKEYGPADQNEFLAAMTRITKRLGGQHFIAAREKLLSGDMHGTIEILLVYYDKTYATGLENKRDRIKLKTAWNGAEVDEYAKSLIEQVTTVPVLV